MKLAIRPFPLDASEAEYAALNRHINRLRQERLPDDPPIPLAETIENLNNIPTFVELLMWAAWDAEHDEIAGLGNIQLTRVEDNRHLAQFEISVLPEYRRQGLARELMKLIADAAQADQRRLLMTSTVDRIPAGEAFLTCLGAQKGLEAHTNQLDMKELDRDLVETWLTRGKENLDHFTLGFWDGPYPEEQLAEIVELIDLGNQQPLGELEIEDIHINGEQLRQIEKNIFARGSQRWTYYLIDRATGKFAGYTETIWNPNRPMILSQEMTGVFPQYRNRGLGRWLKAAMLERVLRERPEVRFVRTGNADSNAAMLKINNELGFKPYMAAALWQVDLSQVKQYLNCEQEGG